MVGEGGHRRLLSTSHHLLEDVIGSNLVTSIADLARLEIEIAALGAGPLVIGSGDSLPGR
jgi:hypothetical protein